MFHRKIYPDKDLSKDDLKIEVVMELLSDAQLLEAVTWIGPYYPKLVKECIVNLSSSINQPDSPEFRKVFV